MRGTAGGEVSFSWRDSRGRTKWEGESLTGSKGESQEEWGECGRGRGTLD